MNIDPIMIVSALFGIMYAEFSGYMLHRLFHTDKIPFLSRSHMRHHLAVFHPNAAQQKDDPGTPLLKRIIRSGIGIEWLPPVCVVFLLAFSILAFLDVKPVYQYTFFATFILWTLFLFVFMHDAMHVRGHWLAQNRILGKWFRGARGKHDTHHIMLNESGKLNTNYGICFFFFDRLFGTYNTKCIHPNDENVTRLYERFPHIMPRK